MEDPSFRDSLLETISRVRTGDIEKNFIIIMETIYPSPLFFLTPIIPNIMVFRKEIYKVAPLFESAAHLKALILCH